MYHREKEMFLDLIVFSRCKLCCLVPHLEKEEHHLEECRAHSYNLRGQYQVCQQEPVNVHANDIQNQFIIDSINDQLGGQTWPTLIKDGPRSHKRFLSCRARYGTTSSSLPTRQSYMSPDQQSPKFHTISTPRPMRDSMAPLDSKTLFLTYLSRWKMEI